MFVNFLEFSFFPNIEKNTKNCEKLLPKNTIISLNLRPKTTRIVNNQCKPSTKNRVNRHKKNKTHHCKMFKPSLNRSEIKNKSGLLVHILREYWRTLFLD